MFDVICFQYNEASIELYCILVKSLKLIYSLPLQVHIVLKLLLIDKFKQQNFP